MTTIGKKTKTQTWNVRTILRRRTVTTAAPGGTAKIRQSDQAWRQQLLTIDCHDCNTVRQRWQQQQHAKSSIEQAN